MRYKVISLILILLLLPSLYYLINKQLSENSSDVQENLDIIHFSQIPYVQMPVKIIQNNDKVEIRNIFIKGEKTNLRITDNTFTLLETGIYSVVFEWRYQNEKKWQKSRLSFKASEYQSTKLNLLKKGKYLALYGSEEIYLGRRYPFIIEVFPFQNNSVLSYSPTEYQYTDVGKIADFEQPQFKYFVRGQVNTFFKWKVTIADDTGKYHTLEELSFELNALNPPQINEILPASVVSNRDEFIKRAVYYIEDGDLKIADMVNNQSYLLLGGYDLGSRLELGFSHGRLVGSEDGSLIATSNDNETFLLKWDGTILKRFEGLISPTFGYGENKNLLFMVNHFRYSRNRVQDNLMQMGIYLHYYDIFEDRLSPLFGPFWISTAEVGYHLVGISADTNLQPLLISEPSQFPGADTALVLQQGPFKQYRIVLLFKNEKLVQVPDYPFYPPLPFPMIEDNRIIEGIKIGWVNKIEPEMPLKISNLNLIYSSEEPVDKTALSHLFHVQNRFAFIKTRGVHDFDIPLSSISEWKFEVHLLDIDANKHLIFKPEREGAIIKNIYLPLGRGYYNY